MEAEFRLCLRTSTSRFLKVEILEMVGWYHGERLQIQRPKAACLHLGGSKSQLQLDTLNWRLESEGKASWRIIFAFNGSFTFSIMVPLTSRDCSPPSLFAVAEIFSSIAIWTLLIRKFKFDYDSSSAGTRLSFEMLPCPFGERAGGEASCATSLTPSSCLIVSNNEAWADFLPSCIPLPTVGLILVTY